MGFMDSRTREPNKQWKDLEDTAEKEGVMNWDTSGASGQRKKRKQYLSDTLKAFFGLDEDPFYPYESGKGWVTRFKISYP